MEHVNCPLYENSLKNPSHLALITKLRAWTYQELNAEVHTIASFLENVGVKENERVAFIARTSPATLLLFFALLRLRAIACPLSFRLPTRLCSDYIQMLKAHHVLDPFLLPPDMRRSQVMPISISFHGPATFLFTSGSSGAPKIACHSFANHYSNAIGAISSLKLEPSSRWLLSLPLFHVSGIGILFRCFLSGASVVLSDAPFAESIPQFGITHASLVPTQLLRILQEPEETLERMKRSLHCLLIGGAPISPSLLNEARLRSLPIQTTYGMTEMSSMATLSEINSGAHSGKVLPLREMKLEEGEIYVRGSTLFQGYWDTASEKIKPHPADEWFRTKDLGRFTTDGNLEIIGRKDRQFISGGENIQPEEIEQALCAISGIRQASVLPIADKEFGERPIAFIDDETKLHDLESIRKELRNSLPSFKHPVRILHYPDQTGIKPSLATLRQHLSQLQEAPVRNQE